MNSTELINNKTNVELNGLPVLDSWALGEKLKKFRQRERQLTSLLHISWIFINPVCGVTVTGRYLANTMKWITVSGVSTPAPTHFHSGCLFSYTGPVFS